MRRLAGVVALLGVAGPAHGYQLADAVWPVEDGPIPWCLVDDGGSGFPEGTPLEAARLAVAMFEAEGIAFVEVGDCPADRAGLLSIDFTATETGAPLATVDVDAPVVRGDCSYERITAFEIPIALGPPLLGMPDEVGSWSCYGTSDLVGVIAHGFGHAVGLAHSCEIDEACVDPAALEALMFWALPPCETRVLTVDDAAGLAALMCSDSGAWAWEPQEEPEEAPARATGTCQSGAGAPSWAFALAAVWVRARRGVRGGCHPHVDG